MSRDIYEELLRYTPLDSLQSSLLVHVSKLLVFGESVTRHRITIYTPLIRTSKKEEKQQVLCICAQKSELTVVRRSSSFLWNRLLQTGNALQDTQYHGYEYVFPIVDNGGKIIGGISFFVERNECDILQEYTLADTMHRLMLTTIEEHIKEYEPISYLDGVIIFDQLGTILYGNEGALHLADIIGMDRRLVGTSIFGSSLKVSAIQQVLHERSPFISEEVYHHMVLRQQLIPIPMGRNESRCILVLHDCTRESKQQQELLVKNSIIKEIHHRVKNNLQTVAGLLRMEARRSNLPEVKVALQEGISRIESMALVHDLVSHYDEDYISIRSIYDELCRLLRQSMVQRNQEVEFRYTGIEHIVSSHQASYISLIINELITNSLEHGLQGQDGNIMLTVEDDEKRVRLILQDSGVGFPNEFNMSKSKRLGMQIINNLVTYELDGTIEIEKGVPGGVVKIYIKKD